jgi:hypothetical protein
LEILAHPNALVKDNMGRYWAQSFPSRWYGTTAMLDRISRDAPLIEFRSPRPANHKLPHSMTKIKSSQNSIS